MHKNNSSSIGRTIIMRIEPIDGMDVTTTLQSTHRPQFTWHLTSCLCFLECHSRSQLTAHWWCDRARVSQRTGHWHWPRWCQPVLLLVLWPLWTLASAHWQLMGPHVVTSLALMMIHFIWLQDCRSEVVHTGQLTPCVCPVLAHASCLACWAPGPPTIIVTSPEHSTRTQTGPQHHRPPRCCQ